MSEEESRALRARLAEAEATIESLTEQLQGFYKAQAAHGGWSLDDYAAAVQSLEAQVRSYVEDNLA